ncbi:MAG TPA: PD-(D/E)XK nuclease family protein [Acidimicrobiales bacterium]|nr:PD-(D/E)XK nuclease family protein [Acidimicrobiales bacterium]
MSFPLPSSLSPSKVSSFKSCALAFRFSAIDKLPEPPSPWTVKGTLVHRALELLFWEVPAGKRNPAAAMDRLRRAWTDIQDDPEFISLELTKADAGEFYTASAALVDNYFSIEDPNGVNVIGTELYLETRIGSMLLRGIIDRLDLLPDGELRVVDYKTGKAPKATYDNSRLGGVQFYAFLCEQVLGRRPAQIQLLHLAEPVAIISTPTAQTTRGLEQRAGAVWTAIERACEREDFRPKPSALCDYCAYKAYCPAFGGSIELATAHAGAAVEVAISA